MSFIFTFRKVDIYIFLYLNNFQGCVFLRTLAKKLLYKKYIYVVSLQKWFGYKE